MASVVIAGDTSGTCTLSAPAVAGTTTLTLPTTSGTVLTTASTTGINASAITSGTLAVAYGGTGATATTGSGNNVLSTSPTLTTPVFSGTATGTYTLGGTPSIAGSALTGTQSIPKAALPTGSVLQVVSTTKTDTLAGSTLTTWTDITGMSVSITPTSSSSKVLVQVSLVGGSYSGIGIGAWRLMRDSTAIDIGDVASNRPRATGYPAGPSQYWPGFSGTVFLDSPATTSSVTYKLQYWAEGSGVFYVNRSSTDRDTTSYDPRTASTIMVMEIAA